MHPTTLAGIWGGIFVFSPLVMLVVCLISPERFQKWLIPLVFIVPFSLLFPMRYPSDNTAVFVAVVIGVSLYGMCAMLVLLISALAKPKKARILKKRKPLRL